MNDASDLAPDQRSPSAPPDRLAIWYSQGLSDGLGDRLLMFDNTGAPSLELLRFRPELAARPEFEAALRQRVHRLRAFAHPSFALVRRVDHLEGDAALALVSNHTAGKRISELLTHPRAQALAFELVRQLSPALAALHAEGEGLTHGAIGPERIILTPERQLVIVEHVLGSALQSLKPTSDRLAELGIATPAGSDGGRFDQATDYWHLALVASSLLVGRLVTADEFGSSVLPALDRLADADGPRSSGAATLRQWLEWAFEQGPRAPVSTAALEAPPPDSVPIVRINPLDRRLARRVSGSDVATSDPVLAAMLLEPSTPRETHQPFPLPTGGRTTKPTEAVTGAKVPDPAPASGVAPAGQVPKTATAADRTSGNTAKPATPRARVSRPAAPAPPPSFARRIQQPWVAAGLAVLVVGGAIVLAAKVRQPQAAVRRSSPGAPVSVAPSSTSPSQGAPGQSSRPASGGPAAATQAAPAPVAPARTTRPSRPAPTTTGVRFSSPVVLHIYEGNRYLGSTADGAVALSAGHRELDLVNEALGYRGRHILDVENGRVLSIDLASPRGRVLVDAVPGTAVFIDGKPVGSTPLANLSIPVGEHQFQFRHPQLGRRTFPALLIRADRLTRVSADFSQ